MIWWSLFCQPHANDVEGWCKLCFGRLKPPARLGQEATVLDQQLDITQSMECRTELDQNIIEDSEAVDTVSFPSHEGILPLGTYEIILELWIVHDMHFLLIKHLRYENSLHSWL